MTDSNFTLQAELDAVRKSDVDISKVTDGGGTIGNATAPAQGDPLKLSEERKSTFMQPSNRPKFDHHGRLAPLVDSLSSRTTAKTVSDNLSAIAEAKTKTYRAIADIDEQMTKLFDDRNKLLADIDDLSRSEAILVAANNEANSPRWQR